VKSIMNKITWRGWVGLGLLFVTGTILPACRWSDSNP